MAEHITTLPPAHSGPTAPGTWWARYETNLGALSRTAVEVIEADSRYIVDRCVLGCGEAGSDAWPSGRVRKGLVMGAVQSGKTASMLGTTALALDAGVDMVVVLGGTRVSLWQQTLHRLTTQLDDHELGPAARSELRLLKPELPRTPVGQLGAPQELYAVSRALARRVIDNRRPIICVAMKHPQHLRALATVIHESLVPAIERTGRPFHLLVLDDEADDGSILDSRSEDHLDPALDHLKTVPRAIVDLWARRPQPEQTASPALFATYVGYTATPQANFLQTDHNPLAPSDFVVGLRTPFDSGDLEPRSSTYMEPSGLKAYYTGGETYYGRLNRTVPVTNSPNPVKDAVRSFLVAGAVRTWAAQERLGPATALRTPFASAQEARVRSPRPHSMLVHPSASVDAQFAAAANLLAVGCGLTPSEAEARVADGERSLPLAELTTAIKAEETLWTATLSAFASSASDVAAAFGLQTPSPTPTSSEWPTIKRLLLDEVIPATVIRVVNSDPAADERPEFEPVEIEPGTWGCAPDTSAIFVSGNVMSRGLTLEGLTTTVFERTTDSPFADTQMQMQRWFGFRGTDLHLCRLYLSSDQLRLFRSYHDTDEALRRSVIGLMLSNRPPPKPVVLQGLDFTATGKLANVSNAPLCPGATPFVRLVNESVPDPNLDVLADVFEADSGDVVCGTLRGRALTTPVSLIDAACILDRLRFERHRPSRDGWEGRRWIDLEAKVGISRDNDSDGLLPLFRPPSDAPATESDYARGGPYAIAAYLRLWAACLTRHARGLVPTDDVDVPWSLVDLARKQLEQPQFYVGLRFGSGEQISDGPLADLPFAIRPMERTVVDGQLVASWGSRTPDPKPGSYFGDQLFDYHVHGGAPPKAPPGEPLWRPAGAPGLLLFHVVKSESLNGLAVAVGVALPLGGPDQFAAHVATDRPPVGAT